MKEEKGIFEQMNVSIEHDPIYDNLNLAKLEEAIGDLVKKKGPTESHRMTIIHTGAAGAKIFNQSMEDYINVSKMCKLFPSFKSTDSCVPFDGDIISVLETFLTDLEE